ncbi:ZCHC3 protein, partial [Amia calva]|nr:ZCHC3 protein [Amia calva]
DVEVWLRRHCEIVSESKRVNDEDGVWTGARRWQVRLQVKVATIGGVRHLPSTVVLGANRGLVFYHGMPKLCRNCGALGHLAAACTVIKCKVCGGEHLTRACKQERACNLCGGGGHLFRNCPSSYANRARALGGGGETENQVEAPLMQIPLDRGREETVLRSLIGSLSDSGSEVEAEGEWTVVAGKRRRMEKRSMGGGVQRARGSILLALPPPLQRPPPLSFTRPTPSPERRFVGLLHSPQWAAWWRTGPKIVTSLQPHDRDSLRGGDRYALPAVVGEPQVLRRGESAPVSSAKKTSGPQWQSHWR